MGLVPIFFSTVCRRGEQRFGSMVDSERLAKLLDPAVASLGLELVGIEFNPGGDGGLLRVYVDVSGRPVTVDDCERASREISALLDVHDPIAGRYTLEVSSPGIDRPLFTPQQFARFVGHEVNITLHAPAAGRRRLRGAIREVQDAAITIEQDGTPVSIDHADIAKARLVPDYAALGLSADRDRHQRGGAGRRRPVQ
jgi:ribosome maturation factor RimP